MQPLISIETVPIKIEYVEKEASHRSGSSQNTAKLKISHDSDRVSIKSEPINISLRDNFLKDSSVNAGTLSYTATARFSKDGKLSISAKLDSADRESYQFQQFNRGIDHMLASVPKAPELEFKDIQIDFDMSFLPSFEDFSNISADFLPPDLVMEIVERPKVIIKYLGGPLYIPPRADPEYMIKEAQGLIVEGKSNFEAKA